jgi:glucose-6-phosphate isomerase
MDSLWARFQRYFVRNPALGISLDVSRMRFEESFLESMAMKARQAFDEMKALEEGAIANRDENRMVGHYWLRAPALAPSPEIRREIEATRVQIAAFTREMHASGRFTDALVIGIGGSALGPQFVSDALGSSADAMRLHFLDNTDPEGFARVLDALGKRLDQTLTIVISKSGGTKETRNGMIETRARYQNAGLDFGAHAVAVTGVESELDKTAVAERWRKRFPMWDWVGGRTSVMSAVGLVPLSLQGIDVTQFLAGAAAMDEWTRLRDTKTNPAMLLALMWHHAGGGRGEKDMVVLPYKDRLLLFSRYLQQLVMESLGKELDRDGNRVNQGIAVYGNKGSTDQHAYVQQLRDGVANFFLTFIEVRASGVNAAIEVEPGITSHDYLEGFLRGTRTALHENGRESVTVSLPEISPFQVGALIALYERAVGFYGSLVNVNAYHQPGVEAGKKAATAVLELQRRVQAALAKSGQSGGGRRAAEIAAAVNADTEAVYHVLTHLAANDRGVRATLGSTAAEDEFAPA